MKKILKFWPLLFFIAVCVLFGLGIANNEFKEDPIWAGIIYLEILFPLVIFFLSVWLSTKVKQNSRLFIMLTF